MAAVKTMNGQCHIYIDEFSDEKCRKENLFIFYIFLIRFFGLITQQA